MNVLRWLFPVLMALSIDGADNGGGPTDGAAAGTDGPAPDTGTEPAAKPDATRTDSGQEPDKPVPDIAAGMLDAISKGLDETKPPEIPPTPEAAKPEVKPVAAETKPTAKPAPELTAQEKASWKPDAQKRFQEITTWGKEQAARADQAITAANEIHAARNQIMGVLEEAQCGPQDLTALLDLNLKIKTGDLDGAIAILDATRADLYKRKGTEAPGVDLLAEHADLDAKVKANELTREDALQIAKARRIESTQTAQQTTQQRQQQQHEQQQKASDDGMRAIEDWCKKKAGSDINYKAKEAKLLPHIDGIMREYQPHQWVATLERLYAQTTVGKPVEPPSVNPPLRATGVKPGGPAPKTALDAINQALGYTT